MAEPSSRRRTLQDRVYTSLSEDIASGAIAPGSALRVAHLAERFGTSQAPVREALRRLTEEGLATTVPYIGSVVRQPSWHEIQEIYALRTELETHAIRRIPAGATRSALAEPRRALRELSRAVRTGDEMQVIEADLEFHRTVCRLANSELLLEVWEMLVQRFRGARLSLLRNHPDDLKTVVETHQSLIDALASGDVVRAQAAFRCHLRDAAEEWARRTGNALDARAFQI